MGGITGRAWNWSTIQNCYSTGIVKAVSGVGGINGNDYWTTYKNNIAINPRISTYSNATVSSIGRINPYDINNTYLKNYAWEHTFLQDSFIVTGTASNKHGQNVTLANLSDSTNFYLNDSLWDGGAWDFTNTWIIIDTVSPFPILKHFSNTLQKIKHSQEIFWAKPLAGAINDTVTDPATGGMFAITYASSNPAVVEVIGNKLIVKGTGVSNITATVAESEFYKSYAITKAFTVFEGGDGTKENPFLISSAEQLDNVRNNLIAHYKLIADLDLSGYDNWQPIGHSYYYYFGGSFDGNNHTISNLTINRPMQGDIGLFGKYYPTTDGDSLKNIILSNVNILGSTNTGAIAGDVRQGFIYNCHTSGNIKGYSNVGGIAGALSYYGGAGKTDFTLGASYCSNSCTIEASNEIVGGIIGYSCGDFYTKKSGKSGFYNTTKIHHCASNGNIKGANRVAGIAGYAENTEILNSYNTGTIYSTDISGGIAGKTKGEITINQCFNAGNITINEDNAGGIIGYFTSDDTTLTALITNCYSTGNIISQTQLRAGGLIGYAYNPITITNSYSTGYVRSSNLAGGIAADMTGSTIKDCFVANAKIQSNGGANRLICDNDGENFFYNNYAWDNLFVKDSVITTGTLNNISGLSVPIDQFSNPDFFGNAGNWNAGAWDMTNIWVLETNTTSPYPVLRCFDNDLQKVKHAQKITWTQDLNAFTGDTFMLTAAGGINAISYTSSNPLTASINNNLAYLHTGGVVQVTATIAESEFYTPDTLKRNITIFEGGAGTKQNPYLISNLQQLDAVRNNLAAHYKLIADIDASEIANWQPIGDGFNYFTGSFDGNAHTISNLSINRPNDQYVALFGYFQPDTLNDSIKNLTMEKVNINGYEFCGAIAGYIYNGSIYNCHVAGKLQGYYYIGGIAGYAETIGDISYCTANCTIKAFEQEAGGIVGEATPAIISNCISYGKISFQYYAGGITGYLSSGALIEDCHSYTELQCTQNSGGGIAGMSNNSQITRCYHKGMISGYEYIGGICGFSENSHISQCFTATTIKSQNYSGGIAGNIQSGSTLKQCYTTGNIENIEGSYAGGICGEVSGGALITECYSTGKITGKTNSAGIAAYVYNSSINNCAAMNAYVGPTNTNGRVMSTFTNATRASNYAWKDMIVNSNIVTGTLTDINGKDTTFAILSDSAFYTNTANWNTNAWNFDTVWTLNKNNISPYPVLKAMDLNVQKTKHAQNIYWGQDFNGAAIGDTILLTAKGGATTIYYTSENPAVAYIDGNQLIIVGNGGIYITAHADSNQYFYADSVKKTLIIRTTAGTKNDPHLIYSIAEMDAVRNDLTAHYRLMADLDMSPVANWMPIGYSGAAFIGSFDGNNHSLRNLTINYPSTYAIGLFVNLDNDTIKNLTLSNVNITGYYDVGSFAGQINGGTIYNCYSSGTVTGLYDYTGGIVGNANNMSTIANCGNSCTISGAYYEMGGIAGWAATSYITNCYFNGNIIGGFEYTGGIVGYGFWDTISNCVVTGTINGNRNTGGIIGYLENSIVDNCYTTGDVYAHAEYGGGIAGFVKESKINNCYSTSAIFGNDAHRIGGIYGHNNSDTLSLIKNCVAVNAKIICTDFYGAGRIAGTEPNHTNCYAWNNIYVDDRKITDGTHNTQHGANATLTDLKNAAFYQNSANWQGAAWDFATSWTMNSNISPYPVLQGIPDSIQQIKHSQIMTNAWAQELPQDGELLQVITLTAPSEGPSEQLVYTSTNPMVASISGDTLFAQQLGNATITVRYPETSFYKASNSFSKNIFITNKASQNITWNQTLSATYGDANISLYATASSGLNVTYSSDNTAVATISGNQLIITGAGTANITAMQAGDTLYAAATDVIKTLTVNRRNLALSNFIAADKVYDGTTTASGTVFDDNRITGDQLNFSYNAAFENKNIGTNKNVNFSNIAFSSGADTGNYILSTTSGVALADITPKTLTVGGTFTAFDKMYDGTTAATINQNNLILVGKITGDNADLHAVAAFASPAVGNNILVSLAAASYISGVDSINYLLSLAGAPTTTANITAAPTYTITFNVAHNLSPITGASISINSQVINTNASGVATIVLSNGTFAYTVTATGYDTVSGNVNVNNANQNVNINLTPIGIANAVVKEIKIYPNPVADVLRIQTSQDKAFEVILRNNNGIIIYKQHFVDGAASIDMKAFTPGLYLMEIKTDNGVRLEKIQKID